MKAHMVSSPQIAWVRVKYSNIMLFLAFMEKFLSADSKIPWLFFLELLLCITDSYKRACHFHDYELIKMKCFIQIRLHDENVATHLHLLMF